MFNFQTETIPGITVIQYSGCINFINRTYFKKAICKALQFESQKYKNNKIIPSISQPVSIKELLLIFKKVTYVSYTGIILKLNI